MVCCISLQALNNERGAPISYSAGDNERVQAVLHGAILPFVASADFASLTHAVQHIAAVADEQDHQFAADQRDGHGFRITAASDFRLLRLAMPSAAFILVAASTKSDFANDFSVQRLVLLSQSRATRLCAFLRRTD